MILLNHYEFYYPKQRHIEMQIQRILRGGWLQREFDSDTPILRGLLEVCV